MSNHRLRSVLAMSTWLLTLLALASGARAAEPLVASVNSVGLTVNDMQRSVDFYTRVLTFEKVSETEVSGDAYEHLYGLFGLRLRIVRMRLGDETLELMQFIAPQGRPAPADSHSNDRWFQHVAIIVSDMNRA